MSYPEQQMQNFIEAGLSEADRCYARIAELEQQNAELVAMFGEAPELTFDQCKKLFAEEIRQIQADYWRKGFIYGFESSGEGWNGEYGADDADINRRADKYAEKIRQGVEP